MNKESINDLTTENRALRIENEELKSRIDAERVQHFQQIEQTRSELILSKLQEIKLRLEMQ